MANQKNIHHLVWFDHLDQAKHCISGKKISQFSSDINVKSLLSKNKQLSNVFYSIINPGSTRFSKSCPELFDTYFAIQRGELISRIQKRNFFQFASRYGVADFISLISKNLEIFSEAITPDFKKLFIKLNPLALKKDALFFHNANPNYYLWIPNNYKLNEVIVCFGNFGNGLNIPFPLAHHILQTQKRALLYIYRHEKPTRDSFFIDEFKIRSEVNFINGLLNAHGLVNRFGLGTSLGGYLVCKYAKALNLKRIINFSGSPGKFTDESIGRDPLNNWLNGFNPELVMTVFSKKDTIDQRIYSRYKYHGLRTKELLIDNGSHGSFLSAYLENHLPFIFNWLFDKD